MDQNLSWQARGFFTLIAAAFFLLLGASSVLAVDTISTSTFIDADGDGTVDHAKITFDENIDLCTYESADWTFSVGGTINVQAITGISVDDPESTGDGVCDGTDAVVYVDLATTADTTGGATDPVIAYTNGTTTGSLSGTTTAEISTDSTITLTDAAAPTVVSESPSASTAAKNTTVVLTFSEPMNTTLAEGTEFAFTRDLGTYTTAWTVGNTVATWTFPTPYNCVESVVFTTDNTELDAALGTPTQLVTTGQADGDISFTTFACTTAPDPSASAPEYGVTLSVDEGDMEAGDRINFSWTTADLDIVNLYYSLDGGTTYVEIATGVSGGSYRWTIPAIEGTVTIKAEGTDLVDVLAEDVVEDAFTVGAEEEVVEEIELVPVAEYAYSYVRGTTFSTVYYIDADGVRHPILDQQTYMTWEDSFATVIMLDDADLASFDMGAPLLPKPSVVLVKVQSANAVYAVVSNPDDEFKPMLREIMSESLANQIYGASWADFVVDIPPTAWPRYTVGEVIDSANDISPGSTMKTRSKIAKLLAA